MCKNLHDGYLTQRFAHLLRLDVTWQGTGEDGRHGALQRIADRAEQFCFIGRNLAVRRR